MDVGTVTEVERHLRALGLRLHEPLDAARFPDGAGQSVTLAHGDTVGEFRVVYSPSMTLSSLPLLNGGHHNPAQLLIIGPRVTERSATLFRRHGTNFIDSLGNAHISFSGIHIDVRGRRPSGGTSRTSQRTAQRGGTNLYSPRRAQVIFALLMWPELLEAPVRELAAAARVSLGTAQTTLDLLRFREYITSRRTLRDQARRHLIRQWAEAYPDGLGAVGRATTFSGAFGDLSAIDDTVFVCGEAAVPTLLQPQTLTLFVEQLPRELIVRNRWGRDSEFPTIFIRRTFWSAPGEAPHHGVADAPWLLTYAELLAGNDERLRTAAEDLRSLHN